MKLSPSNLLTISLKLKLNPSNKRIDQPVLRSIKLTPHMEP